MSLRLWKFLVLAILIIPGLALGESGIGESAYQRHETDIVKFKRDNRPRPDRYWFSDKSLKTINQPVEALLAKARDGDADTQLALSLKYLTGAGVPQNDVEALRWVRKSADVGFVKSEYLLSEFYRYGWGTPKDETQRIQWLEKAAQQGDPRSEFALAKLYAQGKNSAQHRAEILTWITKAAEAGYPPAEHSLGITIMEGGWGAAKDEKSGLDWIVKAVHAKDVDAEVTLAKMKLKGVGAEQDLQGATALFGFAALEGNATAQYELGTSFMSGRGVAKDLVQSYGWFLLSAARGFAPAKEVTVVYEKNLPESTLSKGRDYAKEIEQEIEKREQTHPEPSDIY